MAEAEDGRGAALRLRGWPRSVRTPMAVLAGALFLQLVLHGWTFAAEAFFPDAVAVRADDTRTRLGHLYLASFFVFALAIPLGCFYWFRWLDHSVKNRWAAGDERFKRTPAQVVWAYFIPGLNLFRPLLDLRRLYRSVTRSGEDAPALLTVWWVVTLLHLCLMLFDLREGITAMTAASSALGVLSQLLALMVLRLFAIEQLREPPGREALAGAQGAD
jgi:hypothetical protein